MRPHRCALLGVAAVLFSGCGEERRAPEAAARPAGGTELLERAAERTAALKTYRATVRYAIDDVDGPRVSALTVATADGSRSRAVAREWMGGETFRTRTLTFGREQLMRSYDPRLRRGHKWLRERPLIVVPYGHFLRFVRATDGLANRGEERVRGRAATRFGGPLRTDELRRALGRPAARQFLASAGPVGDLQLDVWVDAKALPVRLRVRADALIATADFTGFDVPLGFRRPKARTIADPRDLPPMEPLPGGAGGGGSS